MDPRKSYCEMRWSDTIVNLDLGRIRHCCKTDDILVSANDLQEQGTEVFSNSKYVRERRQEMLEGVRHKNCRFCWEMEEKKVAHSRDFSESIEVFMRRHGIETFEALKKHPNLTYAKRLESFEIVLKNTCQMRCYYCSPESSSSKEKEFKLYGMDSNFERPPKELQKAFSQKFYEYLPKAITNVAELSFVGGEPLIQNDFYRILDIAIETYKKNPNPEPLRISVITNFSSPPRVIEQFFKKVEALPPSVSVILKASIDNAGKKSEYLRSGLNWERFESNLERAFASGLFSSIRYSITMNALNLSSIKDLLVCVAEFKKRYPSQSTELVPNIIHRPASFSPFVGHPSLAEYLYDCARFIESTPLVDEKNQNRYGRFIKEIGERISQQPETESLKKDRQDLLSTLMFYDQKRGTSFFDIYPEYQWLKEYN